MSNSKPVGTGPKPPEVFMVFFKQAIDSAVEVLREAGLDETQTWRAYERALSQLVDSTLNVNDECRQAA